MGIISNGRCCGRNIVFDAVTGINPAPSSPYPCYYRSQLFDLPQIISPSILETPLGTYSGLQVFSDLAVIKIDYPTLAMYVPTYIIGTAQFYWYIIDIDGTLDLDNWTINWGGVDPVGVNWEQLSCGGELTKGCYEVDFIFDTSTYPIAAINYVNGLYVQDGNPMYLDPIGNGSSWAEVNASLSNILSMMFNGGVNAEIIDNGGGSFKLIITSMASFPTAPPTIGIASDFTLPSEDQTLNLTPITCP